MAISPTCTVNGSATTDGVNVGVSALVTIQLQSITGVNVWQIQCVGVDDSLDAETITSSLTINQLTKTATFTSPAVNQKALIFESKVNNGINSNGLTDPSLVTTFGIYVAGSNSDRVLATNERNEGDDEHGWITTVNAIGRAVSGGVISGDTQKAILSGTISTGDVATSADDATDPKKITKVSSSALAIGTPNVGILLGNYTDGQNAEFAVPNARLDTSVTGLGAGEASWTVVNSSGRVVRKKNPEAGDTVAGWVNTLGDLHFVPSRPDTSDICAAHPPYSADTTGATDSSDKLRQAFADASFSGGSIGLAYASRVVRLPKGMYLLNKPINIQQRGLRVVGEGPFTTCVRVQNYVGPTFYVSGQHGVFPTQPNVMGGRQALVFKHEAVARDDHWLCLSDDGAGAWWHGKSQFCMQFKGTLRTTTDAGISFFVASYGKRATDDNAWGYGEAFGCGYSGTGNGTAALRKKFFLTLTTTAGIKTVYTQNAFDPDDALLREIEWNWSGGFMRIFIDGVEQVLLNSSGSGVDTGALAGTIVQNSWESVLMGTHQQFFTNNRETFTVDMWCASIRGSDIARNTTGYTPNTTNRYTNDSNTMFGLCMANASDADDLDGIFVRGVSRQTAAGTGAGQAYFPMRQDNVATVQGTYDVVFEDLSVSNVYGTCILVNASPTTTVRNCNLTGQNGLCLDCNSFFSRVDNVKMVGANLARVGLRGAASLNSVPLKDLTIQAFDYGLVIAGGANIVFNGSIFVVACRKAYMTFIQVSAINGIGCDMFLTDENSGGVVPDYFFFLSGIGSSLWGNAVVAQAENANAPCWTFSGSGTFGPSRHVFIDTYMNVLPSSTGLLKFLPSCVGSMDLYQPFETANVPRFRPGFIPPTGMVVTYHPDVESGSLTYAMADADYTVTREQHLKGQMEFTGTLTAPRTITLPAIKNGRRVMVNNTNQNLLFKLAGGAVSHTVAPAAAATFFVNNAGTELIKT